MKKLPRRAALALLLCLALILAGCGSGSEKPAASGASGAAVAGDYYLDLTPLGMKLTVFLRLDEAGTFAFANTLSFETVKSAGTFQPSEDGYLMVFTEVNGEEKSVSDGLTSGFAVAGDGSLDFSGNDPLPYGSARITTVSDSDPSVKLVAHPVTDDYVAPSAESAFQAGSYYADGMTESGEPCRHSVAFFEDGTYLHMIAWTEAGKACFACEAGVYGVSTTQLALTPEGGNRVQCEVLDDARLQLNVLPWAGAAERAPLEFTRAEAAPLLALSGAGAITGTPVSFDVSLTLQDDGTYRIVADDYEERGALVLDTAAGFAKQYPDHPATGARGLNQVTTVPSAACSYGADGALTITDLRVCTSAENLTRFKAEVRQTNDH